jgi:hypothetical protein
VQLDEDTLARRRHDLGEDHSDTLTAANDLAISLGTAGRSGAGLPWLPGGHRLSERACRSRAGDLAGGSFARVAICACVANHGRPRSSMPVITRRSIRIR